MDFSVVWAHLESNDLDLTGPSDDWEEADSFWMSQLESLDLEDLRDNTCNDDLRSVGLINVDEPVTQGSQEQQSLGMEDVTPSVLHPKSFTKTCHEHHVYVLVYVIEYVDKFLVT